MNLKDFLASRDSPPELYWSLVIEKDWVQAGIWYIGAEAAEILDISPPAAWEEEDELVGACDAALSSAVAKLPENYKEPDKTVFGVSSSWVTGGEIGDEYLAKIKKVCTDLSLTPVGFVVLPEAIAHLYKSEEGSPMSAIIVGLGAESLEISVFKLGNLVGTTNVARSVSLIEDVIEGLSRFEGASPLPSRIIVYDGKGGELEEAKEELMKATWEGENGESKVKFLHTPNAEILSSDRKVLATSLAGAAEIGNVSVVSSKNADEDLPPAEEIENVSTPLPETSAEELGFVVGEDVTKNQTQSINPQIVPTEASIPVNSTPLSVSQPQKFSTGVKSLFHNFSSKIKISGPKISGQKSKKTLYISLVFVVVILIGGGCAWWFLPKATVTIYVTPKTYQEQVSLSFSTTGQFDENSAIIPGTQISSTASGDKTESTTGTELVGDKATGSVQIANGNGTSIDLAAGTILTSSAGLKFLTGNEASVSGQLIPGSPGTATISVTAGGIGAQYNLAKGEVFKVGVYDKSQVAATSQADFSGGSSQQITAVSADDQNNLEKDLKTELAGQVSDDLAGKVSSDQIFVNDLSNLSVSSATFDHKVGDTADTLKLSLSVSGTGIAADRAKLLQYATDSLKNKIPSGYALRSSQIAFKFTYVGTQNGNLEYNADISADFLPQLNTVSLVNQIAGKSTTVVENYLSTIEGYSRALVALDPPLPGPLKALPHMGKNITIDVVPEQ